MRSISLYGLPTAFQGVLLQVSCVLQAQLTLKLNVNWAYPVGEHQ